MGSGWVLSAYGLAFGGTLLLGGGATDVLGGGGVFFIAAPLCAAAAVAGPRVLPEARAEDPAVGLDPLGGLLVTAALVVILFGVTRIGRAGVISAVVIGPTLAGLAVAAGFVAQERRVCSPLVRPEILRVRSLNARVRRAGVGA